MTNDQSDRNQRAREIQDPEISKRRRRLLQASAASASLIGTLRSGAVLANVSAYQCIVRDEQNQSTLDQLSTTEQSGGWLQVQGFKRTYTHDNPPPGETSPQVFFFFDDIAGEGPHFVESPPGFLTQAPTDPPTGAGWSVLAEEAHALLYSERNDDYTDATGLSLINHNTSNWTALTGSCWSSFGGVA